MANNTNQQDDRVREATPVSINEQIDNDTWQRVACYSGKSHTAISARIEELNKEWDIERYLGVNMSTLAMSGLAAGVFSKNKNWFILPGVVLAFFFQHAVQGWCPPLPLLRKLNIRTSKEIEQEKFALKMLRGDFDHLPDPAAAGVGMIREAVQKS